MNNLYQHKYDLIKRMCSGFSWVLVGTLVERARKRKIDRDKGRKKGKNKNE